MAALHARTRSSVAAAALILAVAGVWAEDDPPRLASQWTDGVVAIDGVADEWPQMAAFSEDPPFEAAFVNSGVYLYAAFRTSDPASRLQVLQQGLIVWFDPGGGDRKQFGVHYPDAALPTAPAGRSGRGGRPPGGAPPREASQDEGRWRRLEILGPEKDDVRSLMLDKTPAVEVALGDDAGTVFYELKVPLRITAETPYAIGAAPGATIGVGLETRKMEAPGPRGGRGRFGGVGGMPGGGKPGGGGAGASRAGGERPPRLEPIKLWLRLALAAGHAG